MLKIKKFLLLLNLFLFLISCGNKTNNNNEKSKSLKIEEQQLYQSSNINDLWQQQQDIVDYQQAIMLTNQKNVFDNHYFQLLINIKQAIKQIQQLKHIKEQDRQKLLTNYQQINKQIKQQQVFINNHQWSFGSWLMVTIQIILLTLIVIIFLHLFYFNREAYFIAPKKKIRDLMNQPRLNIPTYFYQNLLWRYFIDDFLPSYKKTNKILPFSLIGGMEEIDKESNNEIVNNDNNEIKIEEENLVKKDKKISNNVIVTDVDQQKKIPNKIQIPYVQIENMLLNNNNKFIIERIEFIFLAVLIYNDCFKDKNVDFLWDPVFLARFGFHELNHKHNFAKAKLCLFEKFNKKKLTDAFTNYGNDNNASLPKEQFFDFLLNEKKNYFCINNLFNENNDAFLQQQFIKQYYLPIKLAQELQIIINKKQNVWQINDVDKQKENIFFIKCYFFDEYFLFSIKKILFYLLKNDIKEYFKDKHESDKCVIENFYFLLTLIINIKTINDLINFDDVKLPTSLNPKNNQYFEKQTIICGAIIDNNLGDYLKEKFNFYCRNIKTIFFKNNYFINILNYQNDKNNQKNNIENNEKITIYIKNEDFKKNALTFIKDEQNFKRFIDNITKNNENNEKIEKNKEKKKINENEEIKLSLLPIQVEAILLNIQNEILKKNNELEKIKTNTNKQKKNDKQLEENIENILNDKKINISESNQNMIVNNFDDLNIVDIKIDTYEQEHEQNIKNEFFTFFNKKQYLFNLLLINLFSFFFLSNIFCSFYAYFYNFIISIINNSEIITINYQSYVNKKSHFILNEDFYFFNYQDKTIYYRLPFFNSFEQILLTTIYILFDWYVFIMVFIKHNHYFYLNHLFIFLSIIKLWQIIFYSMYFFYQKNNFFYRICECFKQLGQRIYNLFFGWFISSYQITTTLTVNLLTIAVPIVFIIIMLGSFIYNYHDDNINDYFTYLVDKKNKENEKINKNNNESDSVEVGLKTPTKE